MARGEGGREQPNRGRGFGWEFCPRGCARVGGGSGVGGGSVSPAWLLAPRSCPCYGPGECLFSPAVPGRRSSSSK